MMFKMPVKEVSFSGGAELHRVSLFGTQKQGVSSPNAIGCFRLMLGIVLLIMLIAYEARWGVTRSSASISKHIGNLFGHVDDLASPDIQNSLPVIKVAANLISRSSLQIPSPLRRGLSI